MKLYIAVHDDFPDHMTPTLVAHAVLGAHLKWFLMSGDFGARYGNWIDRYFKKCVVRVNQKEFDKIRALHNHNDMQVHEAFESTCMDGNVSCLVVCPFEDDKTPNVLKFAKLWKPKEIEVPYDFPLYKP